MKKIFLSTAFAFIGIYSTSAFAGADCGKADHATWMSKLDMQKKIVNEYGFTIKLFKVDGGCYEIYGWENGKDGKDGKDGKRQKIEVYFNPVNGEIVKKELG